MKAIAAELLRLAKGMTKKKMTFLRSPKVEDSKMNSVQYEVSRLLDTIRRNESIESTFVNRSDDDKSMTLEVGISEHEAVDAIVREIIDVAEKVCDKNGIKMEKD